MKRKIYRCYCCNIHKDDLARPNVLPCENCRWLGNGRPCFHTQISDEALLHRLKEEYSVLQEEYPYLTNYLYRQSKIKFSTAQLMEAWQDKNYIAFTLNQPLLVESLPSSSFSRKRYNLVNNNLYQCKLLICSCS
jgi:hypothetical protein